MTKRPRGRGETNLQNAIRLAIGARPGVLAYVTDASKCYRLDRNGQWRECNPLEPGWPDVTIFVWGRVLGCEVKNPKLRRRDGTAKLRPSQEAMRRVWLEQGCQWVTATSVEQVVEAVERMLAESGRAE